MGDIYFGGTIITMESEHEQPEAVYVEKGIIKDLGDFESLQKTYRNANLINLKGSCLMPSFIDSHSHITMTGQMAFCADLSECESFDDIIMVLEKFIKKHRFKKNQTVIGFGYDHNFLIEQSHPNCQVLDKVSTTIPIMILHISAHFACTNSIALKIAGIDSNTPNPPGGIIGRLNEDNVPSGYFEEAAVQIIQKFLIKHIKFNIFSLPTRMQEIYIKNGITTVQDGATTASNLFMLKFVNLIRLLKLDVVTYPLMNKDGIKILHSNKKYNRKYNRNLKIGGYKLILDGSPQGRSAWLSEPYLGQNENYCGYPWINDRQLEDYIQQTFDDDQQLLAHCNGDAASEQFLNTYERIANRPHNFEKQLRPVMIHCQTVRKDQLLRMKKLNMIASIFVSHVFYWGDVHLKNLGTTRGNNISPAHTALSNGIIITFHQDTPVTKPDMFHSIWCAVNRISRNGTLLGENERISVYEALKAVTINAAYSYFEEDSKGSIKIEKKADLIIVNKNPLVVPKDDIKNIKILKTIKKGKIIYSHEKYN